MRARIRDGNDYTKLQDTPVEPDDARRAVSHFIQRSEQGREIPEELMAFILAGLKRQLATDEGGWFPKEKKVPDLYLPAKAWYCFNFDERFRRLSQGRGLSNRKEQYAAIGLHLRQQSAELFKRLIKHYPDTDRSAYRDNYSENYIEQLINEFKKSGFMLPSESIGADDARFFNLVEATLFCEFALGMEGDKAKEHASEVLDFWNADYVKGKS